MKQIVKYFIPLQARVNNVNLIMMVDSIIVILMRSKVAGEKSSQIVTTSADLVAIKTFPENLIKGEFCF